MKEFNYSLSKLNNKVIPLLVCFLLSSFWVLNLPAQNPYLWLYGDQVSNQTGPTKDFNNAVYGIGKRGNTANDPANFTKYDANGNTIWQIELPPATVLSDFTNAGNNAFLLVGRTLPSTGSVDNQSVLVRVTDNGTTATVNFIRYYFQNGPEGFNRIITRQPISATQAFAIVGSEMANNGQDIVNLYNLDAGGNITNKHSYFLNDDEYAYGLIPDIANSLTLLGHLTPLATTVNPYANYLTVDANFNYLEAFRYNQRSHFHDAIIETDSGIKIVVGENENQNGFIAMIAPGGTVLWSYEMPGNSKLYRIVGQPQGNYYALGTAVVAGQTRTIVHRFTTGIVPGPLLLWSRYLDEGEVNFQDGFLELTANNQLLYTDARELNPDGFGSRDILTGVLDLDLNSCMTIEVPFQLVQYPMDPVELQIPNQEQPLPPFELMEPGQPDLLAMVNPCGSDPCNPDLEPPVIVCPDDFTISAGCDDGAVVTYTVTATDNCTAAVTVSCTPASGTYFPIGTTTVICTAADAAGNTSNCSFNVDVTASGNSLLIECPVDGPYIVLDDNCSGVIPDVTGMVNVQTNCPYTISQAPLAGTVITGPGITNVLVTVTSITGETATCLIPVTAIDTTPPTISCPNDVTVTGDLTAGGTNVIFVDPIANDNCAVNWTCSHASGDFFPCGSTTITCTATDPSGNIATCSFTIFVDCDDCPIIGPPQITPNDNCGLTNDVCFNITGGAQPYTFTLYSCPNSTFPQYEPSIDANGQPIIDSSMVQLANPLSNFNGLTICFLDLTPGRYYLLVRDANGKWKWKCFVVPPALEVICPPIIVPNDSCGTTSNVYISVFGGVMPYSFTFYECPDPTLPEYTPEVGSDGQPTIDANMILMPNALTTYDPANITLCIMNLPPGRYYLLVQDAGGRWKWKCFVVPPVQDTTPTIICPDDITATSTAATGGAIVTFPDPIVNSDCPVQWSCSHASGDFFPCGTTTVSCTATDINGNTVTCIFTVTVICNNPCNPDVTPPVLDCPLSFSVAVDCEDGAVVTYDVAATDNCDNIVTITCTPPPGSYFPVGTTTVICVATDAAGNSTTCTFDVTVVSIGTTPTIICPDDITANNTAGTTGTVVTFPDPIVNSDCPVQWTCSHASGDFFPCGTTTVSCTATDINGNTVTCSFTVTVICNNPCNPDITPPVLDCPLSFSVAVDCEDGAVVTYDVAATDNCDNIVTITCAPPSGSYFPVGTTTVICIATDAAGNSTTCTFDVTVVSIGTTPTIICPDDITANNTAGTTGTIVTFPDPIVNSDCPVQWTCSHASGDFFPCGTTTVTCTATDTNGNAVTCIFTVTVICNNPCNPDITPPVLDCPLSFSVAVDCEDGAVVTYDVAATDNCDNIVTISCTPPPGSYFPVGTTTVICVATDAAGNSTTCTFDVTVVSIGTTPTIICPDDITANNTAGTTGTVVTFPDPIVNSDCPVQWTCSHASGDFFPCGTTTVSCTATDINGNTVTCIFTVTVICNNPCNPDITPPVLDCPLSFSVAVDCEDGAVVTYDVAATDNCSNVVTITCTPPPGSYFPVGTTTVICVATDAAGNSTTCTFDVTVVSIGTTPTIICPDDITANNTAGTTGTIVTFPDPIVNSDCPVQWTCSHASGDFFPCGTTTVSCTATDINGNAVTCIFTVTVECGCDPCENISVVAEPTSISSDLGGCCYNLDIANECAQQLYTRVIVDIQTPGVTFSTATIGAPSAGNWNFCPTTSTSQVCLEPTAGFVPIGFHDDVLNFCLTGISSPLQSPQILSVSFYCIDPLTGQEVVCCEKIITLDCPVQPTGPCLEILEKRITCTIDANGNPKYIIGLKVTNTTPGLVADYVNATILSPAGLMFDPSGNIPLSTPLNYLETGSITACIIGAIPPPSYGMLINLQLCNSTQNFCCDDGVNVGFALPACFATECAPGDVIIDAEITDTDNAYQVNGSITSDAAISDAAVVEYTSGVSIDLLPGFEVALGAEFYANVNPCISGNLMSDGIDVQVARFSETTTDLVLHVKEAGNYSLYLLDKNGNEVAVLSESYDVGPHPVSLLLGKQKKGLFTLEVDTGKALLVDEIMIE